MEEEEESSEEEEEEIVPVVRKQDFLNPEQEPCAVQVRLDYSLFRPYLSLVG